MKLSKLFFWIKKQKGTSRTARPSYAFDQKLVKRIRTNIIPKWSQLKYVGNFLTGLEKKIVGISTAIFILSTIALGTTWIFSHQTVLPATGGEYTEALIGEPKYINPLFASANDVDADITSLMYSGLFSYNTQQQLVPDLAENYTVSEDGKIYDIKLRSNIAWSDNEPLTANDILFTFQTIQDPEVGSPLISAFQGVTVEKIDDFSIRFTLKDAFSPFLHSLTLGILPEHIWSAIPPSGVRLAKTNLQPVGTGPWKFNKLTKDASGNIQSYVLEPNSTYYKQPPYLKKLTFKFYPDFIQAATALKSQDVNAVSFLPSDLTEKIIGKNFIAQQFTLPQYTAVFFNEDSAILKDSNIRAALASALDKQSIIDNALQKNVTLINSPILEGMLGYNPEIKTPAFDIDAANEMLNKNWKKIQPEDFFQTQYDSILKTREEEISAIKANTSTPPEEQEAQIKKIEEETAQSIRDEMNPEQSFYRKNKNNDILHITITTVESPEYQQVANEIAKMWRAVGVKTDINTSASTQISREVLRNRSYDALLYGEIIGTDSDPFPFWHSSQTAYPGLNLSMFSDRAADKLLEDARTTTTEQIKIENYRKFQDIIAKDNPAIFLYTPIYNFVFSKEIKGVTFTTIPSPSSRFVDMEHWYIKTKRQWNKSN